MSAGPRDIGELQAEIEHTRDDLADTVDQLTARLDVKARVRDSVTTDDGRPTPAVLAVAGLVGLGIVALIVVRRRR